MDYEPATVPMEPPEEINGRAFEYWTYGELVTLIHELGSLAHKAAGETRHRLLVKQSDTMRCLGYLGFLLAPAADLQLAYKKAVSQQNAAELGSDDYFEAMNRLAEIQRMAGAELNHLSRNCFSPDEFPA